MSNIKIALAGNPNSGKTTLFNALTGANQYVGNWPGVTVEKKEGKYKKNKEVGLVDLPGIYSLSPYTIEEVIARDYLLEERPDAIINIVDGSNLERNLYLTTQLIELGIPVVVAVNMMDIVRKRGDRIKSEELEKVLACRVVEISAARNEGISDLIEIAIDLAGSDKAQQVSHIFSRPVEDAISEIEGKLDGVAEEQKRFLAVKLFERDEKLLKRFEGLSNLEDIIAPVEESLDDDSESIIINERYDFISGIIDSCYKKANKGKLTVSDKIDKIVTNRILGLPIFAAVMWFVYWVAVSTVGTAATDWLNEQFEEGIVPWLATTLENMNVADWLNGLVSDGIVAGVGAVLGFVPQMLVLFFMLAILEYCGYLARVAFVLDRIFRKFGLSGKSFIPMLISSGCAIPGIMASRTIENEKDRRMTIITTSFVPCSAKIPLIALIAGAFFRDQSWVAPLAYFVGIGAIIVSGIILKKFKIFSGDPAPFVMELPDYHLPKLSAVLRSMWERGWSFIKKAGTIIVLATIVIWFLQAFGNEGGSFGMVENMENSLLASIGRAFAWIFVPLGFGQWKAAVASVTGLVAKETIIATYGILYGFAEVSEEGQEIWTRLAADYSVLGGFSFLVFNLLCAPCFVAIGAIRREMNSAKWTVFAVAYETIFAYLITLMVYQFGLLILEGVFTVWTGIAFGLLAFFLYLLFRPQKEYTSEHLQARAAQNV